MKRYLVLFAVAAVVAMLSLPTASIALEPQTVPRKTATPPPEAAPLITTFPAIIVSIDLAANTIVVKDRNGKLWNFVVDPKYGIDLSQYKVGAKVTATVATPAPSGNPETRARMSKSQLVKLQ